MMKIEALLFDLDGTLIDTAPDLVDALQLLLKENNRSPLPYDTVRPHVPNGSFGIVGCGFPDVTDKEEFEKLRLRYLALYGEICCEKAIIFDGLETQIQQWESTGKPWGIVTNKPEQFTLPLLMHLNLSDRVSVLVCGDTLSKRKPDPMPLTFAADKLDLSTEQCLYIGDDKRDVIACKAANMPCVTVTYDFIPEDEAPDTWGATAIIDMPNQLITTIHTLNADVCNNME